MNSLQDIYHLAAIFMNLIRSTVSLVWIPTSNFLDGKDFIIFIHSTNSENQVWIICNLNFSLLMWIMIVIEGGSKFSWCWFVEKIFFLQKRLVIHDYYYILIDYFNLLIYINIYLLININYYYYLLYILLLFFIQKRLGWITWT